MQLIVTASKVYHTPKTKGIPTNTYISHTNWLKRINTFTGIIFSSWSGENGIHTLEYWDD